MTSHSNLSGTILQFSGRSADPLHMGTTLDIYLDEYSDQELVDLYAHHSPGAVRPDATHVAISRASAAAYALERRGYVEQAGSWVHSTHPALRATA